MKYTVLVNKNNKIKNSYYNNLELVSAISIYNKEIQVEKTVYDNYLLLKDYLLKNNIEIGIESSYRTMEEQERIIKEYTEKYGDDYTSKYVAPTWYSEHHTALAIDISIKVNNKYLTEDEELSGKYDDMFKIIHNSLYKFGFILRYPKEKESITSYNYEPWHIRYVGYVPAKIIYDNRLTLEEYLNNYSGILVINKEKGMTSRDVVNKVSNILGIKKIGHTGTLDPMAEGVLVLTIGKATKLGDLLTSKYKEYIATIKRGILTDTLDTTGHVIKTSEVVDIDKNKLLKSFLKTYNQEVPVYSAVKVNGKKLYEYARNNEEVELPKKEVTIKEIELLDDKDFKFRCLVSKGTYIRSLIRDMGKAIGECFSMSGLIRTKQGKFDISSSYTLNDIETGNFKVLNICDVIDNIKIVKVDEALAKKIRNGVRLDNKFGDNDYILFRNSDNKNIAIYKKESNCIKMYIML